MTERSGNRHIHVWRRGAFRRGEEGDGAGGKAGYSWGAGRTGISERWDAGALECVGVLR